MTSIRHVIETAAREGSLLPNAVWMRARNAAGTDDIEIVRVTEDDELEFGADIVVGSDTAEVTELKIKTSETGYAEIIFQKDGENAFSVGIAANGDLYVYNYVGSLDVLSFNATTGAVEFTQPVVFASTVGFYTTPAIAKPTVSGAKAGNAALTSLCTALASLGLITNSTS